MIRIQTVIYIVRYWFVQIPLFRWYARITEVVVLVSLSCTVVGMYCPFFIRRAAYQVSYSNRFVLELRSCKMIEEEDLIC